MGHVYAIDTISVSRNDYIISISIYLRCLILSCIPYLELLLVS